MKKIPTRLRPKCSCGTKMTLISFIHYYGEEVFWDCKNKKCELNSGKEYMYNSEPDEIIRD